MGRKVSKVKRYVVWEGKNAGVVDKRRVDFVLNSWYNVPLTTRFETEEQATVAFELGYKKYMEGLKYYESKGESIKEYHKTLVFKSDFF